MMAELHPIPEESLYLQYQKWEEENDRTLDRLIGEAWLEYHRPCPKDVRMTSAQQLLACSSCPGIMKCELGQRIVKGSGFSKLSIAEIIAKEEE